MGQGMHVRVVYGVQLPEKLSYLIDSEIVENWMLRGTGEGRNALQLYTSYESSPRCVGFTVADDDGNINTWYNPTATDGICHVQKGLLFYRKAISLAALPEQIRLADPEYYDAVEAGWKEFCEDVLRHMRVELPEPELILVSDWH